MADITTALLDELLPEEAAEVEAQRRNERLETLQNRVKLAVQQAIQHFEEDLEPDMKTATEYYYGREFGNEQERRSTVVSTTVRDITLSQIPSLARILWGPDNVVEFSPDLPQKEEQANQATDCVRAIILEQNPGFLSTIATLKDGLVRRLAWWKWWADDEDRPEQIEFSGFSEQQLQVVAADESVDDIEVTAQYEGALEIQPGEMGLAVLYDGHIKRRNKRRKIYAREVPPEEIAFTPGTKSEDEAPCFVHHRYVPADYLLARGFDEELVMRHAGKYDETTDGLELTRQVTGNAPHDMGSAEALDDSQKPVLFTEAYLFVAVDQQYGGRAERRRFDCIGPDYEIANGDGLGECVDELPFAVFTPEPEPHTITGLSNWDLGKDLQLINSQIERSTLDSLAEAVNPVTVVVAGEVNMNDLLKPDTSRIVRVRKDVNNSIREVKSTFVGSDTLPMLAYYKEVAERRFGVDHGASGLDADALQSTEKQAAASVLSAKQQRIEMIARVYAETTMRRLFRGVLKLFIQNNDRPTWMRLRGKWTEVDPRSWDALMDVTVNVALGQGTPQDRLAAIAGIAAQTKELMAAGSPLVTNVELRRVLARGYRLAGENPDAFLRPWGEQEEMAMQQQMAAQPKTPTPEETLVEIERQKAMASAAIDAEKLDLERLKLELQDDRERDKMSIDAVLAERKIEAEFMVDIKDLEIKQQTAATRASSAAAPGSAA